MSQDMKQAPLSEEEGSVAQAETLVLFAPSLEGLLAASVVYKHSLYAETPTPIALPVPKSMINSVTVEDVKSAKNLYILGYSLPPALQELEDSSDIEVFVYTADSIQDGYSTYGVQLWHDILDEIPVSGEVWYLDQARNPESEVAQSPKVDYVLTAFEALGPRFEVWPTFNPDTYYYIGLGAQVEMDAHVGKALDSVQTAFLKYQGKSLKVALSYDPLTFLTTAPVILERVSEVDAVVLLAQIHGYNYCTFYVRPDKESEFPPVKKVASCKLEPYDFGDFVIEPVAIEGEAICV